MKIIIFGTGKKYQEFKKYLHDISNIEVLALIDNDETKWGKILDGKVVDNPANISRYVYDFIVLMSDYAFEMKKQLMDMRCAEDKMIHFKDFFAKQGCNWVEYYGECSVRECTNNKSMLIISEDLGFHGAAIVAFEMAKLATKVGYSVTIIGTGGSSAFIEEVCRHGIDVFVCEFIERMQEENLRWVQRFDIVLVNTLLLAKCAVELAKNRKVIWYLHEAFSEYSRMDYWKGELWEGIENENISIYAVSEIAKNNFIKYFSYKKNITILPPFVRDVDGYPHEIALAEKKIKICVVAGYEKVKGHNVILDAYEKLTHEVRNQCEIYFVGKTKDDLYARQILKRIEDHPNCHQEGLMNQNVLLGFYKKMDIVVVPSLEETMSLVAIESMMCGKVCIVSDNTGIASYIKEKENGLLFLNNNVNSLADKMTWCIENRGKFDTIGEKARETYCHHFTIDVFNERFKDMLSVGWVEY